MPPFLESWKSNGFLRHLRVTLLDYHHAHLSGTLYSKVAIGFLLLATALLFNSGANAYTAEVNNGFVTTGDIILDHLPVVDVDSTFFWGIAAFIIFVIILGLKRPARAPFMLESAAVFIAIRSGFVILTHVAAPVDHSAVLVGNFFQRLIAGSGNDLFFSGHTGFPFLFMLMFWNDKRLRFLFLAMSLFYGFVVLIGHLHYSIDVFSAFFITYGIHHIARYLFREDYEAFKRTV